MVLEQKKKKKKKWIPGETQFSPGTKIKHLIVNMIKKSRDYATINT